MPTMPATTAAPVPTPPEPADAAPTPTTTPTVHSILPPTINTSLIFYVIIADLGCIL